MTDKELVAEMAMKLEGYELCQSERHTTQVYVRNGDRAWYFGDRQQAIRAWRKGWHGVEWWDIPKGEYPL